MGRKSTIPIEVGERPPHPKKPYLFRLQEKDSEWLTAMAKEHSVTRMEILEGVINYARNNTISVVMRGESNARFFKWREKHAVSKPQN